MTSPAPRPALGEVVVADLTDPRERQVTLDLDAITEGLRARLLATQLFEPSAAADAGDHPLTTRARAEILTDPVQVGSRGLDRARVRLILATHPSNAPGAVVARLDGAGEAEFTAEPAKRVRGKGQAGEEASTPLRVGSTKLVLRIAGDLLASYAAKRRLATASAADLRAALRADGGELRIEAIGVVGDRKLGEDADALYPLLDDPDEVTRDAALGALIRLGDRHAVSILAKSRSLRDRREMGKVIEAVSRLGGEEADEYLAFVASAHEDEEIRAEAAAARERMHQRERQAGK